MARDIADDAVALIVSVPAGPLGDRRCGCRPGLDANQLVTVAVASFGGSADLLDQQQQPSMRRTGRWSSAPCRGWRWSAVDARRTSPAVRLHAALARLAPVATVRLTVGTGQPALAGALSGAARRPGTPDPAQRRSKGAEVGPSVRPRTWRCSPRFPTTSTASAARAGAGRRDWRNDAGLGNLAAFSTAPGSWSRAAEARTASTSTTKWRPRAHRARPRPASPTASMFLAPAFAS